MKTEKGWKIPKLQNSTSYELGNQLNYSVAIIEFGKTGEYYVVVMDYNNIVKSVSDNLNSDFSFCERTTGINDKIKYNTFVTFINEFDENYIVYINGEELKWEEQE